MQRIGSSWQLFTDNRSVAYFSLIYQTFRREGLKRIAGATDKPFNIPPSFNHSFVCNKQLIPVSFAHKFSFIRMKINNFAESKLQLGIANQLFRPTSNVSISNTVTKRIRNTLFSRMDDITIGIEKRGCPSVFSKESKKIEQKFVAMSSISPCM